MTQAIGFVDFVTGVLGVRLTPAQRVLALVAFDRLEPAELDGEDRDLAARLFGPVDEIPAAARTVLVAVCGARSGKSYLLGALYSLWRALTADLSGLAPGEQASALIVAPDTRLGRQVLRYALGAARAVPAIARLVDSEGSDGFTLVRPDGGRVAVEVLPATRGGSAVRGRSLVSAVLDEVAFFRDESAVVNDGDLFRAVAPRVLAGGMVVLASTPWLEAGLLFTEFSANWGAPARAVAAHAPTALMRPDPTTAGIIARERARDPDNAARELDAEFLAGGAGLFFGPELIGPAIDRDLPTFERPEGGARATIGGDIGLVADASAFIAIHRAGDTFIVADALEMRPSRGKPLKLSDVVAAGCTFAAKHGQRAIRVDHHVLSEARNHLPGGFRLEPVPGGQDEKAKRFLRAREIMRQGGLRIVGPLARLGTQLGQVVGRPTPGGGTQIILPRRAGTHLDLAAAFVVGVWAASRPHDDDLHIGASSSGRFERLGGSRGW